MRVEFCFREYYFFRPVITNVSWGFMAIGLRLNIKISASEKLKPALAGCAVFANTVVNALIGYLLM